MSLGSVKLVDFTKKALYKRLSPYKCVISNGEHDFVCHAIFVISASEYFGTLYSNAEEKCEIEPGVLVPRIRVTFGNSLLEEYIRFAYFDEMKITTQNAESLLEFVTFINSLEMLSQVEKFLCLLADSLPDTVEQLQQYLQVADQFQLNQLKRKLTHRLALPVVSSASASASQLV